MDIAFNRKATKRPLEGAASVPVPITDDVSDDSELVKYYLNFLML